MSKPLLFSEYLFWDVDKNKIDYEKNAGYIIERVITKGTLKDWFTLQKYYSNSKIKGVCLKARYLDDITLNFISTFCEVPKENFKCYSRKQLTRELWPY